jgi:hypothetical protein
LGVEKAAQDDMREGLWIQQKQDIGIRVE